MGPEGNVLMRGTQYFEDNQNFPVSPNQNPKNMAFGEGQFEQSPLRKDKQDRQRFNSPNRLPWMKNNQSARDLRKSDSKNYLGHNPNTAEFNPLKMSNFSRKYQGKDQKRMNTGNNQQFEQPNENNFLHPQAQNDFRGSSYQNQNQSRSQSRRKRRERRGRSKNKNMAMSMYDFDPQEGNPYPQQPQQNLNPGYNEQPVQNLNIPQNIAQIVPPPPPAEYSPAVDEMDFHKQRFLSPTQKKYTRNLSSKKFQTVGKTPNNTKKFQNFLANQNNNNPTTNFQGNNFSTNVTQASVQPNPQNLNTPSIRGTYYNTNSIRGTRYLSLNTEQEKKFTETQPNNYTLANTEATSRRTTFATNQPTTSENFLSNTTSRRETIAGTQGQTIQMIADQGQQNQQQQQQNQVYTIVQQPQPQPQVMGIVNTAAPILDPLVSQRNKEYSYDNNKSSFLKRIAEGNFSDPSPGYQDYIKDCGVQIQAAKYLASQIPVNVIRQATPVRVPFTTTCKYFIKEKKGTKLLLLDLDETLIHSVPIQYGAPVTENFSYVLNIPLEDGTGKIEV